MDAPPLPDPGRYRLRSEICKVLTEPKRLMLIDALGAGPATVGELAAAIGATLANASQHLAVLRAAGLVEGHRAGTAIVYRLTEPTIVDACRVIERIIDRRVGPPAGSTPVRAHDSRPISAAGSAADHSALLARR